MLLFLDKWCYVCRKCHELEDLTASNLCIERCERLALKKTFVLFLRLMLQMQVTHLWIPVCITWSCPSILPRRSWESVCWLLQWRKASISTEPLTAMRDTRKCFFDTSEASCVCVQKIWSPRCALMRLAFFFTCEALGTCGISLLAANDKINPCNYTASKKLAQNTVWCFKGLHNWKLRWFCLTVPKNRSSDFQCSLIQISNSVFV